jgi:hypothetical protein
VSEAVGFNVDLEKQKTLNEEIEHRMSVLSKTMDYFLKV